MVEVVYGFTRVSTPKQNIERQVRNILKDYPNAYIVKETYTGTKVVRESKEWNKLYNQIKKDLENNKRVIVVYDSVSRMSRDADSGVKLYEELYKLGVELVFLKEPLINTCVYRETLKKANIPRTGTNVDIILEALEEYLIELTKTQVRRAFEEAEKEVKDLHVKTSEGILTAKLNGKQVGRISGREYISKKEIDSKELILKNSKDFNGYNSDAEVIKICGISRNSYYKYKKKLIEEKKSSVTL